MIFSDRQNAALDGGRHTLRRSIFCRLRATMPTLHSQAGGETPGVVDDDRACVFRHSRRTATSVCIVIAERISSLLFVQLAFIFGYSVASPRQRLFIQPAFSFI